MSIECHNNIVFFLNILFYANAESCIKFNVDINGQALHNKIVKQSVYIH